jgi:hypothetical protein
MRIAVLGPLEVLTDDSTPVAVPDPAERLLLAVLAAGAPRAVGTDHLLRALGDGTSPEVLHTHVTRLRAALQPGLPPRASGQYVLRRGAGYALAVPRGDVDALHVADLVRHGRARLAEGDPAEATRLLTSALDLWRGQPYSDWPDAAFADEERSRLAAVRADAEAALREARSRPVRAPVATRAPVAVRPAGSTATFVPVPRLPDERPAPAREPTVAPGPQPEPDAGAADGAPLPARRSRQTVVLAALLVLALVVAGLTVWSQRAAERAAAAAEDRLALQVEANALAGAARAAGALDTSLLLSVQALRLAETPETRSGLLTSVAALGRIERVVSFRGTPQEPVLSSGGRTLAFSVGTGIVAWPVGPDTEPQLLMDVPARWGTWLAAAPSPTEDQLVAAGVRDGVPWLRMISASAQSRLLIEGDEIRGWPLDGAVSPDGRRVRLVVAVPGPETDESSRWELLDVSVADGTMRDTGLAGTFPASVDELRADVADDAGSFVLWAVDGQVPATLVDLTDRRPVSIAARTRPVPTAAFRALPAGAAQLWEDGQVTLLDGRGTTVQRLHAHGAPVRDVVVAPDGTWAVTLGDGAEVRRWPIEPSTGRWSPPETLAGHLADVVGGAVDADGETLFTVARDNTVIAWDMTLDGVVDRERVQRGSADPAAWIADACAVVGRDFRPGEWKRYLSDRPWRPTCSDLR